MIPQSPHIGLLSYIRVLFLPHTITSLLNNSILELYFVFHGSQSIEGPKCYSCSNCYCSISVLLILFLYTPLITSSNPLLFYSFTSPPRTVINIFPSHMSYLVFLSLLNCISKYSVFHRSYKNFLIARSLYQYFILNSKFKIFYSKLYSQYSSPYPHFKSLPTLLLVDHVLHPYGPYIHIYST